MELKKRYIEKFGDTYFLLGHRKEDGEEVWLQDFSWDCKWYWGGGYLKVFNKPKRDINEHYHFDSTFFRGKGELPRYDYWKDCVLSEKEWWRMLDLMKQFYAYKEGAECAQYGGHMTSYVERSSFERKPEIAKELNKQIEEVIVPMVRNLLIK